MNRRFALWVSSIGALAISSVIASCASTAPGSASEKPERTGQPARVAYLNYGAGPGGQRLEIVNQSHTDRTELYSRARPIEEAVTKVASDEILEELIGFFRTKGFFEHSAKGPAPVTGNGQYSQALEIEAPGEYVHVTVHKGLTSDERQRFLECAQAFVLIYNDTYQLQSVDRAPDWDPSGGAARPSQGGSAGAKKSPDR
jgi:hypothetical protein